eukprot:1356661-Rhodomonas_salina.2
MGGSILTRSSSMPATCQHHGLAQYRTPRSKAVGRYSTITEVSTGHRRAKPKGDIVAYAMSVPGIA